MLQQIATMTENNMRANYNRTTKETKTLAKKNRNPLDVNDLLIETDFWGLGKRLGTKLPVRGNLNLAGDKAAVLTPSLHH